MAALQKNHKLLLGQFLEGIELVTIRRVRVPIGALSDNKETNNGCSRAATTPAI